MPPPQKKFPPLHFRWFAIKLTTILRLEVSRWLNLVMKPHLVSSQRWVRHREITARCARWRLVTELKMTLHLDENISPWNSIPTNGIAYFHNVRYKIIKFPFLHKKLLLTALLERLIQPTVILVRFGIICIQISTTRCYFNEDVGLLPKKCITEVYFYNDDGVTFLWWFHLTLFPREYNS